VFRKIGRFEYTAKKKQMAQKISYLKK